MPSKKSEDTGKKSVETKKATKKCTDLKPEPKKPKEAKTAEPKKKKEKKEAEIITWKPFPKE